MAIKFLNTATAATQAVGDNSTKIATTAYADAAAAAIPIGNYLPLSAGASKPLTGSLYIPNYIYHAGDAGTFIGFPSNDRLIIGTNGGTRVDITNSGFCLGDSGSNISVSTILDEDDMASDSATALVTQQSIKAYVDAQTPGAGVFLPLAGGTMNTNAAITMSGSLTTSANVYAQRFYDQGDNAFYGDFEGTSQFNHVKINSVLGTRNFVSGSYGWQLEQSTTTADPVTFRFDNQKYRIYAGGGAGEIMTFLEGGNVGIGATNPGAKLHVEGGSFPQVRINDDTNEGESGIRFRSFDGVSNGVHGDIFVDGAGGNEVGRMGFRIPWNGTEKMTILSSGSVGIGTASPGHKLEVNGNVKADYALLGRGFRAANRGELHLNGTGTTDVAEMFFGYGDGFTEANIRWGISDRGTTDGRLIFYRGPANGGFLSALELKDNLDVIVPNGKVGVGTTAPAARLHVKEPSGSTSQIKMSAASNEANYGYLTMLDNTVNTAKLTFGTTYGYNTPVDAMTVWNGMVGIGTASPDQKLHIKGGDIQTQDTTGSNGVLRIRSTITGTPSTGGYPNVGAGDAVIEGGGTTQRQAGVITLMNGDSSISAGQDLGVIQFVGKDDQANGYCTSQIISTTSSIMGTGASGGGILRFLTSPGNTGAAVEERMRINNSGRVMIGTTTSTSNANLTVKESLAIQSGSSTVLSISTGYGSSFINTGTSGGTVRFGAPTSYTTNVYVQGTIEAVSSVQMGNNSAAASAANAGSTRYRVSGNNSYMDMSMRTGATTYAWVNIVQNNW